MTDKNLSAAAETLMALAACIAEYRGSNAWRFARLAQRLHYVASLIDEGASPARAVLAPIELAPDFVLPTSMSPWGAVRTDRLDQAIATVASLKRLMPEGLAKDADPVLDQLEDLRRQLCAGDSPRGAVVQHVLSHQPGTEDLSAARLAAARVALARHGVVIATSLVLTYTNGARSSGLTIEQVEAMAEKWDAGTMPPAAGAVRTAVVAA